MTVPDLSVYQVFDLSNKGSFTRVSGTTSDFGFLTETDLAAESILKVYPGAENGAFIITLLFSALIVVSFLAAQ